MKNLTRILMIMVVAILPLSMEAQDVTPLVKLSEEYLQLEAQITELDSLIRQEEEKFFTLRMSWYKTCQEYLQERQFKEEELDLLISQTIPEIDGQELYNELLYAKRCFGRGEEYQYKDIPAPTMNSAVTPVASPKKNNKKNDKKTPPSNDKKENPVVDNDADKKNTTPKQEEPIVTDPSKDRNGEDKPSAPVIKKDSDNEETAPVTTPVVSDPKNSNPSKVEKKRDKGEMEEGTSKKSKNNDGSR